ncbi:MAG: class E sortase [Actinobacteria bacterium]|nr:class E sortase [Actinomycetota bacterium]
MNRLSARITMGSIIASIIALTLAPVSAMASPSPMSDSSTSGKVVKPSKYVEVARLVIPSLGITEKVVPGTTMDVYDRGVGLWPTSPLAGQRGNFVVGGHRTSGHKPFRNIDKLRVSDSIIVHAALRP